MNFSYNDNITQTVEQQDPRIHGFYGSKSIFVSDAPPILYGISSRRYTVCWVLVAMKMLQITISSREKHPIYLRTIGMTIKIEFIDALKLVLRWWSATAGVPTYSAIAVNNSSVYISCIEFKTGKVKSKYEWKNVLIIVKLNMYILCLVIYFVYIYAQCFTKKLN